MVTNAVTMKQAPDCDRQENLFWFRRDPWDETLPGVTPLIIAEKFDYNVAYTQKGHLRYVQLKIEELPNYSVDLGNYTVALHMYGNLVVISKAGESFPLAERFVDIWAPTPKDDPEGPMVFYRLILESSD